MNWKKLWKRINLSIILVTCLAVVAGVWFIGEDAPESFELVEESGCYTYDDGSTVCADSTPWEPYCENYEDEYGYYYETCYEYEGGEELCPIVSGDVAHSYDVGYYFPAHWDYCIVTEFTADDGIDLGGITLDEDIIGSASAGVPIIITGSKVYGAIFGKKKMRKAVQDAIEQHYQVINE